MHLPLRIKNNDASSFTAITCNDFAEFNEKKIIVERLKDNFDNRTKTADDLGISRKTLFNKIKRFGIG
ncbi:MAG: helix-turn-helix domain-containing protein [Pseudomonadota bacterium]